MGQLLTLRTNTERANSIQEAHKCGISRDRGGCESRARRGALEGDTGLGHGFEPACERRVRRSSSDLDLAQLRPVPKREVSLFVERQRWPFTEDRKFGLIRPQRADSDRRLDADVVSP